MTAGLLEMVRVGSSCTNERSVHVPKLHAVDMDSVVLKSVP